MSKLKLVTRLVNSKHLQKFPMKVQMVGVLTNTLSNFLELVFQVGGKPLHAAPLACNSGNIGRLRSTI
jgi:Na+-driven multidrug efflux pump